MNAAALIALTLALAPDAGKPTEWPQWMGPTRDNVWHDTGILDKFPAGGPKVFWKANINAGYSGPAVAGGFVYITDYNTKEKTDEGNFGRKPTSGTERVVCFDILGKQVWKYEYPVKYAISYPAGPRCTPLVHDGKVYTLGAMGHLACLKADTGEILWKKELTEVYGAKPALWGYAAHPVIDGKKLITLGGIDGSHIVALDKDTGNEIWKSGSQKEQGYSPVQFHTIGGVRQMIIAGPTAVRGLDPETGKRFWSEEYDATSGSIIMTPIIVGDYVFVGGYKDKNLLLKLGVKDGVPTAAKVWKDDKKLAISPVNVQPFAIENVVYGFSDDGSMSGFEVPSGKRLWTGTGPLGGEEPKGSATAFIVKNGDRFFFFAETGDLVIGKLSKTGYEEIDRAKVIEPTGTAFGRKVAWCMPAFADKKMFVRNDKELLCISLAK
ncbi:PQQ-like beta-propeller repeat protein [soil metagenome]